MFVYLVLFCVAISPAVSSVAKDRTNSCSTNEFACRDGACVSLGSICDGISDCPDGSDEVCSGKSLGGSDDLVLHRSRRLATQCRGYEFPCRNGECVSLDSLCNHFKDCSDGSDEECTLKSLGGPDDLVLNRYRRQATQCRRNQWQCRDGTCISFDGKCDGMVDCPDKSDETHALCRKTKCQPNWFRCTYGACVDGTAPCNNIVECADQSDELLPRCRNETDEQVNFRCLDGSTSIPASDICDGNPDCPDGSDEIVRTCAAKTCPSYLFQCAYGACVDQGSDCNGKQECADGSDESDELCNRQLPTNPTVPTRPTQSGKCVLPPYPEHGTYVVANAPYAKPGQSFPALQLNATCRSGYGVKGPNIVFCNDGTWSQSIPKCVRFCKLDNSPSVNYRCLVTDGSIEGRRPCNPFEPSGTVVIPECNSPNYYSSDTLPYMRCIDDSWDYVAVCSPECGRVTPDGVDLIIDGRPAKRGELPWHAGIYRKTTNPYMQICGGSLVTNRVVISAAHCFWNDVSKQQPASMYAVAVGKLYRPWNNARDEDAQKSDVKEIKIPVRFQGSAANFQDDIALIIVETAFVYKTYVRPVCLNFDVNFDRRQLHPGKLGKVAGWGLVSENGAASPILKVVELPYVDIEQCITQSPPGFREYITSDKICAGFGNGTALCKGDSGGGLAFPDSERGTDRYYLRGIVSTAANNENLCNSNTLTTFTQIIKHEHFVKEYL